MADRFDLIIRNAAIYDGSGAAPFAGDVAIKDDRIAAVGDGDRRGPRNRRARPHDRARLHRRS